MAIILKKATGVVETFMLRFVPGGPKREATLFTACNF